MTIHLHSKDRTISKLLAYLTLLWGGVLSSTALLAQPVFPAKPIHLIIFTPPGGALDFLARTVSQGLTEKFKQPVIVESRLGAAGNVGASAIAKSAPDGYTIGVVTIATHGINPSVYGSKLPYDPIKDFAPITLAVELKNVLVVNPSLPVKSVPDLVAYARANPGKLSFGSAGTGTSQHFAGEMFKSVAQIDLVHIPYKGLAQAVQDLIGGEIQVMFSSVSDALPHIRSGKLRAIGLASVEGAASLPDVPAIANQGYPGFDVVSWFGFVAPAGTPRDIVLRYNKDIIAALNQPDVVTRLAGAGMDVKTSSPEQFSSFMASEIAKWAPIVKATQATPP
jgi:tripartite-type tricarboxylate transporter receptor subunit TctC